jgi:MFS family permease
MKASTINYPGILSEKDHSAAYFALLYFICFTSSVIGGTISTLMSVYLPVVVKDLKSSVGAAEINSISAYINAIFIFGWALGGFIWGIISDRLGRKKSLLFAMFCYAVFAIGTGFATTWPMLVVCRFMSGFGVGGVLVSSYILLSEVWPEKTKTIFIGILSIAFPIGIFSAGLINYLITSWREGFLVGLIPLLLATLGFFVVKESKAWKKHQLDNTVKNNPFNIIISKDFRRRIVIGSVIYGTNLIGLWAIFSWLPTWVQSLVNITDAHKERGLTMMFLGMGGLTGGFLSGWLVNLIGAVLSLVLFKTNSTFSTLIYIELAVLALFFGASQGVLAVYITKLFPTGIRATAAGFCFNVGRLVTALAVLFVGMLVSILGGYGNSLSLFSMVFIIGLITILSVKKEEFNHSNN